MSSETKSARARRIDAAMGRVPCDVVLKNARFLDVFTLTWRQADVAIADGRYRVEGDYLVLAKLQTWFPTKADGR